MSPFAPLRTLFDLSSLVSLMLIDQSTTLENRSVGSNWNTTLSYSLPQLRAAGYNYYGNEPMYSGITGEEFKADIYLGVVYYQRLRHMVNDKFQVRTTGPVDPLTRQPIKVCPSVQFTRAVAYLFQLGSKTSRWYSIR